jgi:hypothetical protein
MTRAYRIYEAPDGCDMSYCGERDTLAEAKAFAETEPTGLQKSLWDTARAAGHCAGKSAPHGGIEDDEPISWHGASGWHCVVGVTY